MFKFIHIQVFIVYQKKKKKIKKGKMKRKKNGTLVKGKINYLLQLLHIQRWQLSDTKTIFFSFLQSRVRCPLSQLVVINAVKEYKVDIMHEDLKKKK